MKKLKFCLVGAIYHIMSFSFGKGFFRSPDDIGGVWILARWFPISNHWRRYIYTSAICFWKSLEATTKNCQIVAACVSCRQASLWYLFVLFFPSHDLFPKIAFRKQLSFVELLARRTHRWNLLSCQSPECFSNKMGVCIDHLLPSGSVHYICCMSVVNILDCLKKNKMSTLIQVQFTYRREFY